MLFDFSKLFWGVVQLGNLMVLLLVIGTAGLFLGLRGSRSFLAVLTLVFVAIAVLPVGRWAIAPLENRFPQPVLPARVDGIILVGGAIRLTVTRAHGQAATNEYAERISETLELARRFPEAKVLITGGDAGRVPGGPVEAEVMRRMLAAEGLDEDRMMLEERSRNTFENALYSMALARPRPDQTWLLVTSAFHMPRAVGCFRHVGWNVLPFPVDYQTAQSPLIDWSFLPHLRVLDLAWHEWLGLAAYRALGRIDHWFPGPAPPRAS